ncbi:unnamed protein product [Adineta ricciae]|uniref:TIR domain-containing protein n=1 Tax=Adineta ricciae TaxID=249248 RepID=A0A815ESI3_ADIRI|nr:unnamed protein product [Adineta ricciae]CAF1319345.1 unnamed protein product [Adineta ricciae]
MEDELKQFIDSLLIRPVEVNTLNSLTYLFDRLATKSFSSLTTQSFQSLCVLKNWTWDCLGDDSSQWIYPPEYLSLFHALSSFHRNLIFYHESIDNDIKASLLIPETNDQIDRVFQHINQSHDDNDPFIIIVGQYFDNLSFFLRENPEYDTSPILRHINQCLAQNYLMTDQFKIYLDQLQQTELPKAIFTGKQLFYVKTCPFSLSSYLIARTQNFVVTSEEIINHIGKDYLQIMNIHTQQIETWDKEFLNVIGYLSSLVLACSWWGGGKTFAIKILLPTEQVACDLIQSLIRIISYEPYQEYNRSEQLTNELILIYIISKLLLFIIQTQSVNWVFSSNPSYSQTLCKIAETSSYPFTSLCIYFMLGEILPEDKLKEMKFATHVECFFYSILDQAWHNPLRKYKQLPLSFLLRSSVSFSKNDAMTQKIADLQLISFFMEMSDEYPIVYDFIWGFSFNHQIQKQLRENTPFIHKLTRLSNQATDEQIRKAVDGILWNLQIHQQSHPSTDISSQNTFDIMISYSHKDKSLCKQIYDELTRRNYRVWIDFDQMHGNVMDAMAQAIDRSQTIIICMSEEYRKSNFCRAEAHYAFQQQRHIVPVLMQKHYKPDGWLLFLIGQLLYVDFTKYEFDQAMGMLLKELKANDTTGDATVPIQAENHSTVSSIILSSASQKATSLPALSKSIGDWTRAQVQEWLVAKNLPQMSRLLTDCNGRSLLYFHDYIKHGNVNQVVQLLHEDSLRKSGQTLSLVELSCFRTLIESHIGSNTSKDNNKTRSFICCRMM